MYSTTYKTPKQLEMAKAHRLSQGGQTAYLCRFIFSGHYFAATDNAVLPYGDFEIVKTYMAQ